jgi:hypothetical protein
MWVILCLKAGSAEKVTTVQKKAQYYFDIIVSLVS